MTDLLTLMRWFIWAPVGKSQRSSPVSFPIRCTSSCRFWASLRGSLHSSPVRVICTRWSEISRRQWQLTLQAGSVCFPGTANTAEGEEAIVGISQTPKQMLPVSGKPFSYQNRVICLCVFPFSTKQSPTEVFKIYGSTKYTIQFNCILFI